MELISTIGLSIIILAVILLTWRYLIALIALIIAGMFFFTGCGIGVFIMGIIDEPLVGKPITSGFLYWGILVALVVISGLLARYTNKDCI